MNPLKWKLHNQIALALALAIASGIALQTTGSSLAWMLPLGSFIGTLFLNALKMVVLPLIVTSIIVAVIRVGRDRDFARLGIRTLGFYLLSSSLAILTGWALVNLIQPGVVSDSTRITMMEVSSPPASLTDQVTQRSGSDIAEVFLRILPANIIDAGSDNGQMLGVIVFSMIFGFFVTRLAGDKLKAQISFWEGLNEVMLRMTRWIIRFAPIGIWGLVTPVIAQASWDLFAVMLVFAGTVVGALAIHTFLTMPMLLAFTAGVSPTKHLRAVAPALLTAFSTASSASTLPVTMSCVEENAGISKRITGFTLPLGATVNMDGTALYECVAVIFLAQLYGIEISLGTQLVVLLLALLTSVGVAAIPSASLVAIVVILNATGFPPEIIAQGLGIILIVDRILDMCRTAVNVFGDSVAAVCVAKWEGETPYTPESNSS